MRHDFPFSRFEGLLNRLYGLLVFRRRLRAIGDGSCVSALATLEGMGQIAIGAGSHVSRRCLLTVVPPPGDAPPSRLDLGNNTYIGRGCVLSACGILRIGSEVTFGDNVYVSAGQHGYATPGVSVLRQPMTRGELEIGDGAWIGFGAFISTTSRLTIGAGAIVAANSVVTRDVEPLTMVGGVPARPLRRFDPESRQWRRIEDGGAG